MATWYERLDAVLKRREWGDAAQLAEDVKLDESTIARYRKGKRKPDPETLAAICKRLNVSADWLLGLSDSAGVPASELDGAVEQLSAALRRLAPYSGTDVLARLSSLAGIAATTSQRKA